MLSPLQAVEKMRENMKTITQMSALYRVSLRTLRFYEDRGLMTPMRIGLQRLYSSGDEVRLQIILKGKRLGLSLSEIERLILSSIADQTDETELDPDRIAAVTLAPDLIREKIEALEQRRDATSDAIAELTSRLQNVKPTGSS